MENSALLGYYAVYLGLTHPDTAHPYSRVLVTLDDKFTTCLRTSGSLKPAPRYNILEDRSCQLLNKLV